MVGSTRTSPPARPEAVRLNRWPPTTVTLSSPALGMHLEQQQGVGGEGAGFRGGGNEGNKEGCVAEGVEVSGFRFQRRGAEFTGGREGGGGIVCALCGTEAGASGTAAALGPEAFKPYLPLYKP